MKKNTKPQDAEQEHIIDDANLIDGEAYPNCEGEQCANMADGEPVAEAEPTVVAGGEQTADDKKIQGDKKLAEEAAIWHEKYIRLQAEFDNYRKRTLKEKMDLVSSAGEEVIKSLLPVIDDMDRALEAMETSKDATAVKQGIVLISNKLRHTLRSRGVSEIEAMGKALDTDFHEAVAKVPAPKGGKGKIVDIVQKGYKLNDKVIRHSKVVVGE